MSLRRLLAGLCASAVLAGCYSHKPMTVMVRDGRTQAGVDGAVVIVRALNFFDPDPPGDLVNPSPGRSVRGVTDAQGVVRFGGGASCPGHILILCEGRPPHSVLYEVHPGDTGAPTRWIDAQVPGDGEPPTLQVQLTP
jgi:hypothetical protein